MSVENVIFYDIRTLTIWNVILLDIDASIKVRRTYLLHHKRYKAGNLQESRKRGSEKGPLFHCMWECTKTVPFITAKSIFLILWLCASLMHVVYGLFCFEMVYPVWNVVSCIWINKKFRGEEEPAPQWQNEESVKKWNWLWYKTHHRICETWWHGYAGLIWNWLASSWQR